MSTEESFTAEAAQEYVYGHLHLSDDAGVDALDSGEHDEAIEEYTFERAVAELERLVSTKYLGVHTSTQLKLGLSGVLIIIDALKPKTPAKDWQWD